MPSCKTGTAIAPVTTHETTGATTNGSLGRELPRLEASTMAKYGTKSKQEVKKSMHEYKHGKLKSGKSGKKVTNPKQAIAIGLSKARKHGGKVPRKSKPK
jgi:Family of unknown function (DUF6496)